LTLGDVVAKVSSIDRNGKGYADVPDAPDFPNHRASFPGSPWIERDLGGAAAGARA
jgi:hypothetical protein